MPRVTPTLLGPSPKTTIGRDEFEKFAAAIASGVSELFERTDRLAEVMASIAIVLRESGLVNVEVEDAGEDEDSVEVVTEPPFVANEDGPIGR